MENLRKYGEPPYRVALLHGGPGAPGEMAPVARRLSRGAGILEPMQSALTVDGQVEELRALLQEHADLPVVLAGWSWGAWLAYILAARHPGMVKKLVMVGSPPFEEGYAVEIMRTRLERLDVTKRAEVLALMGELEKTEGSDHGRCLGRFAELMHEADSFDPLPREEEIPACQNEVNAAVWREAAEMRRSGELLRLGELIECKVVAVHGDHDPHPASGVLGPLAGVVTDFRYILLENCGHCPWLERQAADLFFSLMREELEEE